MHWPDNHKRFAALGWVAAQICESFVQEWTPEDVVHLHDWQAAMAAVYLRSGKVSRAKSVFTIHNLAYKGVVPQDTEMAAIRRYFTDLRLPPEINSRTIESIGFLEAGFGTPIISPPLVAHMHVRLLLSLGAWASPAYLGLGRHSGSSVEYAMELIRSCGILQLINYCRNHIISL